MFFSFRELIHLPGKPAGVYEAFPIFFQRKKRNFKLPSSLRQQINAPELRKAKR